MDASAYLLRHGWTGGGLGYKQSGIKKPLLSSQKHGFQKKGLGGKPLGGHSDQWWLGAFDAGLKSLGSDKPAVPPPALIRGPSFFKAELYRNFVQGEGLSGTLSDQTASRATSQASSSVDTAAAHERPSAAVKKDKKRKRKEQDIASEGDKPSRESKEDRRKRKEERRAKKEQRRLRKLQKQGG